MLVITPCAAGRDDRRGEHRRPCIISGEPALQSAEIVLGKLLARMLMILVYLMAGAPLLFLLMLFGGVELS